MMFPQRDMYARSPEGHVEYQLFSQDYFSAADVHLYLGDIWVDELTQFSFQLQEQVMPVFGYHSYVANTYARGRRQIQGAFVVNFKSVGYLNEILKHRDAIEYAVSEGKELPADPKIYEKYKLDEVLRLYGKSGFDQIAEEYERAIWGEAESGDEEGLLSSRFTPYFQPGDRQGFDIRIHYGETSQSTVNSQFYKDNKKAPNMTVEVINGVQIMGMSKQMGTSQQGAPIQEQYTFIASDLNGSSI